MTLPAARLLPREERRPAALETPSFDSHYVRQMALAHE